MKHSSILFFLFVFILLDGKKPHKPNPPYRLVYAGVAML